MVTNTYYDNEDAPDMSNPDVAMALYEQQMAGLANIEETADATLEEIGKKLGATLKFAQEKGLDKLAERTEAAWHHAQGLNRQVHHLTSAAAGAGAAIKALKEQRDAVVNDHLKLVDAIEGGREYADERLMTFANEIREENSAEAMAYAAEIDQENLTEFLQGEIGIPYPAAQHYASELLDFLFGGIAGTEEQYDALRALCETFPLPEWVQKRVDSGKG